MVQMQASLDRLIQSFRNGGVSGTIYSLNNELNLYKRRLDHIANQSISYGCEIRYADPNQITRSTGREKAFKHRRADVGLVVGGDWDNMGSAYHQSRFYESIECVFDDDGDWEDTELAESKDFNSEGWDEYTTSLERLHKRIKENGYQSQRDLGEQPYPIPFSKGTYWDEIAVDISRDGELLWVDGRHRLAIAQYLDIDEIPVVVIARHRLADRGQG